MRQPDSNERLLCHLDNLVEFFSSYPKGKIPEKYVDEMLEPDDKVWQQAK